MVDEQESKEIKKKERGLYRKEERKEIKKQLERIKANK